MTIEARYLQFESSVEFERARMTQTYDVLAIDPQWEPESDELPRILYSGAIENMDEAKHPERGNRLFLEVFPAADGVDANMAIDDAIWLCEQATAIEEHDLKIDCFKAAEILLLHAAKEGSASAYESLGYLYASNSCEDEFLRYCNCREEECADGYPIEKRSAYCFERAAALSEQAQ